MMHAPILPTPSCQQVQHDSAGSDRAYDPAHRCQCLARITSVPHAKVDKTRMRVIVIHALRNAMMPVVTGGGSDLQALLLVAIPIETIFV